MRELTIEQLVEVGERLLGIEHRSRSDDEVRNLLAEFNNGQLSMGTIPDWQRIWTRAVILPEHEKLTNLGRAIYPPNPSSTDGRANSAGRKTLYAASNTRVALDEIEARSDSRVAVILIRQRPDRSMALQVVGEIESILNSGRSLVGATRNENDIVEMSATDLERLDKDYFVDAVMAELFRRPGREYQATSIFATSTYSKGLGLVFPSVRTRGGINVALDHAAFDWNYEVVSIAEIQIKRFFGKSCYKSEVTRFATRFEQDGSIVWNNLDSPEYEWSIQEGLVLPREFVGWRVIP
jgi:hypothetical protein